MPRPRRSAAVCFAALVLLGLALAACGGGGLEGTYSLKDGDQTMKDFTLELGADDFTLSGPDPLGGEDVAINGTYTVEDDSITLTMEDGTESDVGSVDGDLLVFEDVTWERQ
jgi:hypothetical protein